MTAKKSSKAAKSATPRLLSGGNPQIPKGDGDAPVKAYIAAMPGWKRTVGKKLDALIVAAVPKLHKAVKYNTPLYGIEGQGDWFMSYHCFDQYVKVAFFRGAGLKPMPPEGSKMKDVRYYHVHEHDEIDEAEFTRWVKQASKLPGEKL